MGKPNTIEKHYRVQEVAELTGLCAATVRRRCLMGEIGYRKSQRAVLIPESEVQRLLGTLVPATPRAAS